MRKNVGGRDRAARAVIGSSFLAAALLPSILKAGRKRPVGSFGRCTRHCLAGLLPRQRTVEA